MMRLKGWLSGGKGVGCKLGNSQADLGGGRECTYFHCFKSIDVLWIPVHGDCTTTS